jgi:glycosyltransferase family protein
MLFLISVIKLYFRKFLTFLKIIKGCIDYPFKVKKYKLPEILSVEESIDKVLNDKLSVARFGDSEYLYLTGKSDGLQKSNKKLRDGLIRALTNKNPKLLVSLVDYENLEDKTLMAKLSAMMFHSKTISGYISFLNPTYVYGNSNMTRFYIGSKDKTQVSRLFDKWKKVWDKKDVVIVEGKNTRFGYGNDLLDNASSISRVICPSKAAFDYYSDILDFVKKLDKSRLLLFALGASATVAASDLTDEGYQVIDIGNLDVEYEWYKMGATKVTAIKNKQVSEVAGGTNVQEVDDQNYLSQIIHRIGV